MRRKVYQVQVTCDRCQKEVIHQRVQYVGASLPAGWGVETVSGCGMTDYTRHDDLCPDCLMHAKVALRLPPPRVP